MMSTPTEQMQAAGVPAHEGPAWGSRRELNPLETLMWRAESNPRMRSTVCGLELLDRTPDWDRLLAAHDWASRLVPRFRQHVVEPPLGLGTPTWAVDGDFDLGYHVRRMKVPAPGAWSELLEAAQQIGMTPFDRARSPWEAVLFEGLADGRAAYLLKLHHSTSDGMGGIQLLSMLHSRTREHNPDKPQRDAPVPERPGALSLMLGQAVRDVKAVPDLARGAASLARRLARPRDATRDAIGYAASLRRVLADPDAAGSPLLKGRSMSWRYLALDVQFADLRGASKTAGATLNDAYLAALLGALRLYHEQLGAPVQVVPIAIPISVRRDSDAAGGNEFTGARLAGPVGIADPIERMHAIGALVQGARAEPALNGMGLLAPALARLPRAAVSDFVGSLTASNDMQASNVPGIREDVYLAGAKIERMYGFGPLPGCALMVTLVTHGSTCCIGVNVDPAAVTDIDRFANCLRAGFEEVLAVEGEGPAGDRGAVELRV